MIRKSQVKLSKNSIKQMQKEEEKIMYYPKKQMLSCRLCTDIFKKPITLGCGHTFCYYCLYKFMRQQCDYKRQKEMRIQSKSLEQNQQESRQDHSMPLPLCPTCSSLIFKPIKSYKQNLTLTNLICHAKYTPALKFQNQVYDEQVQNFDHKILISIQKPKIQPLPYCHSLIRFSTCFLDDILEQSHQSYVVVDWPHFKKSISIHILQQDIGLAGKIQRVEVEYRSSSHNKENHYRAYFTGLFFVNILSKKSIEINLKSRYYTEALFSTEQNQYARLSICKSEPFHSKNILPLLAFNRFFSFYDTMNNPHYLNQIYKHIDPTPLFERSNPENMIYCCMRVLKLKADQRKEMIESFDDHFRIIKINQFLQKMGHLQLEEIFQISIPGKYNSAFVFGVVIFLILLHCIQNQIKIL